MNLSVIARSAALTVALLALLAVSWPAEAQQRPMRRAERAQVNQDSAAQGRQALQRGQRPPARQAVAPNNLNYGQMSPEERRQLRRDIEQHGRDLYRERRERR